MILSASTQEKSGSESVLPCRLFQPKNIFTVIILTEKIAGSDAFTCVSQAK
jgi:hypothetical protein